MKEKLVSITIGLFIFLVVGGMLYMAIKNPYQYPGYDVTTPPHYSGKQPIGW
ncbi:uncharacterized protein METZ01_LOCUS379129 [marine metagenome]|jgi:hypothetical protein|uniref:Uncharacterized protein n=1 Tax=marine metagenome TaxID=408172 RepID=A0A382TX48_9ZZZZ|tara:strand:- start:41 stop:196 length:156 start_codon:yes stop_codon:yes gene_type:complete